MAAGKKNQRAQKDIPSSTNGCLVRTILLTILVATSFAAAFYFLFLRSGPTPPPASKPMPRIAQVKPAPPRAEEPKPASPAPPAEPLSATQPPAQAAPPAAEPKPEPAPSASTAPEPAPTPPPAASAANGPRIAIIIDDIGETKAIAEQIIALDLPLAFSILPHTPHANHLASLAKARGRDILLHLPMEATDPKWAPGPGGLLLSMSKAEIIATINQDLDTPYHAIGVNNHMGSKFSADPVAMRVFLNTIKARGLFFIDSLTAINSVGYPLARDLGLKTAKRDVFLDNDQDETKILAQIGKLIALARQHGSAIGIGHPHPVTLAALRASQARLTQEVTMVPVHELVR
jgi:polysaccharide deacetylase 2 family uncharacterized protein YibQ